MRYTKSLSTPEIFIFIVGGLALFYVSILLAWRNDWSGTWLWVAAIALSVALLRIFVFTYQMWEAIKGDVARMTPKQAILYNCIPVFNLYWLYQCIWGFAQDCNQYILQHSLSVSLLPTRYYFWYVTFWILSIIPYVGIVTVPLAIGCLVVVLSSSIRALRVIVQH